MGRLPEDQQLLALALITMADDEGYFRAEPELIRGDVQPFCEDLAKLSRGLARLSEVGWIVLSVHPEQGSIGKINKCVSSPSFGPRSCNNHATENKGWGTFIPN